jgi:hypothetical protein
LTLERRAALDFIRGDGFAKVASIGLIVVMATAFYFPALVSGKTLAHGDISILDLQFFDFFARALRGNVSPLWSSQIYGGHPLFAEGQVAFAHPLNIVWAAIVTPFVGPIYSMNLYYWLLQILCGLGVLGLCRCLGASAWASAFAALAASHSALWAHEHYVLPVHQTLAFIPWSLWAFEHWLKRPSLRSAVSFGVACALVCLSGYPQGIHGTIIYLVATLSVVPFQSELRREWARTWRQRTLLGLLACAVGAGLAAVQLLPLWELVGLSHRNKGIGLTYAVDWTWYLRGFLVAESTVRYHPGLGSAFVLVLASLAFLVPVPARAKGHMIAALALLTLGTERGTAVFRFVYDHHLLPGLGYFRQVVMYLAIGAFGLSVLAAFAVDAVARPRAELVDRERVSPSAAYWAIVVLVAAFWIYALVTIHYDENAAAHLGFALVAAAACAGLVRARRRSLLAPVLSIVLVTEIAALRLRPFNFFDADVFGVPQSVTAILTSSDWRDYKVMTVSPAGLAVLFAPKQAGLETNIKQIVSAVSPMTNLMWDVSSMEGYLALPLARRMAIEDLLKDEIFGRTATPSGLRFIDLLAVRFVTHTGELGAPAFRIIDMGQRSDASAKDNTEHVTLENQAALPRFQIYTRHEYVESLEEAIQAIKSSKSRTLIVESPPGDSVPQPSEPTGNSGDQRSAAEFSVLKATDTEYQVDVRALEPVWLFLADANYPGWVASIDGKSAPIFTAQVLGKAVQIPTGSHQVTMSFSSQTFKVGLIITLVTAFVALLLLLPIRLIRSGLGRADATKSQPRA